MSHCDVQGIIRGACHDTVHSNSNMRHLGPVPIGKKSKPERYVLRGSAMPLWKVLDEGTSKIDSSVAKMLTVNFR